MVSRFSVRFLVVGASLCALGSLMALPSAAQELTEEWGYDRKGDDYTSFEVRDLARCQAACERDRRCVAYTFDAPTCYLKDEINDKKTRFGVVTGYKRHDDSGHGDHEDGYDERYVELTEERGWDRKGDDYSSFRTRTLEDCQDSCREDRRCLAYTYDTRERTCYLKDEVNEPRESRRMITGVRESSEDERGYPEHGRLTEERGWDRKGDDYTSFRARGLYDCQAACEKDERCRAYTFDTRNDVCYLKDEINSRRENERMITGYKPEDE